MTFSRNDVFKKLVIRAGQALVIAVAIAPLSALAQPRYAVVPTATIYPGEIIGAGRVTEVEVTNPNLLGGYAERAGDVIGKVSKKTLVPGRTIQVSNLRDPYTITRGTTVRLTFSLSGMVISAAGTPLQDAMIGDVIRVRNLDSGITVSGTVMADGTVEVMQK